MGEDLNIKDTDLYQTPEKFREFFKKKFYEPKLDVCADGENAFTCKDYYNENDNGLKQKWHGLVWCNPPYSCPHLWVDKAIKEKYNCLNIALLLKGDFSTDWFRKLEKDGEFAIYLLAPRIQFKFPQQLVEKKKKEGKKISGNNFCSILAFYDDLPPEELIRYLNWKN